MRSSFRAPVALLPTGVARLVALVVMLLLALPAMASERVVIDHISFDEKTMELTLHADVLDARGVPVTKLKEKDIEILADGQAFDIVDGSMEIETAKEAGEPIAVLLLLNASASYFIQSETEQHSTFQVQREGAISFIKQLGGADKVAVYAYREDMPFEQIYGFASGFKQAVEAIENYKPPDDLDDATILGSKKRARKMQPRLTSAIKKAMDYVVQNLDTIEAARRRILVVMSDGKARTTRKAKIIKKYEDLNEVNAEYKIRINALAYSPDDQQFMSTLQTLANGSGGLYTRIDHKDFARIPSFWDALAARIKKQYIIKVQLASLPDWGEQIKGKEEQNLNVTLKVTGKDDSVNEAQFPDVRMPKRGIDWMSILKWVGIVLGSVLGIFLLIMVIKGIAGRGGDEEVIVERQEYDGPDRGKLHVRAGPLAGDTFPLIDDVTTIGSMKGNTIVIMDGSVSRRHAAIKIDQMRYEIADMNSTNGVLVNGARIHKVFLRDGDKIAIGTTEMEFRLK